MDNTSLDKKCLGIINRLLCKYIEGSNRVRNVHSINSDLIVLLFEHITKQSIPDLLANENKEAEAHNVQAVIDTLSLDILGISLSHITGEDVVAGNLATICDLLEVLEGVGTYLKSEKQVQPLQRSRIIKRKIRKKSSLVSSQSITSDSSDIVTQIEQFLKRITYDEKKKSSSDSADSVKTSQQSSTVVDCNQAKKSTSSILSSSSLVSKLTSVQPQGFHLKAVASNLHKSSSTTTQLSAFKIKPSFEDPHSNSTIFSLPRVQFEFEDQDSIKEVIIANKKNKDKIESKAERNEASSNIIPQIEERKLKRKISRLSKKENTKPVSIVPQKEVEEMYENNFESRVRGLLSKNSYNSKASHLKKLHLQSIRKPLKRLPVSPCKKSFLLPHTLRHRSTSHSSARRKTFRKSPVKRGVLRPREKSLPKSQEGFLQEFFKEFPEHQLTPSILNHIKNKYQQHLLAMHKQVKTILLKKPKTQKQAEEASKKQSRLNDIIKKDIQQQQHLTNLKEQKRFENQIKFKLRDARLQSAKMKQYCEEFQTEMRKKMQKRNYSEELIIENVFKESLKIQKEQVDNLCQEAKDAGDMDAEQHLIYLEALENLYQTQFSMLTESISAEKRDEEIRDKANQQEMIAMQREFQEQLKQEIRFMQQVIVDCTEDIHFREMDAEQFKAKLRKRQ